MRALRLVHNIISTQCPSIHNTRLTALLAGVDSLLGGSCLTLTDLGRNLISPARTKHNIKRMDRLLGNSQLHNERAEIYRALCHHLCQQTLRPIILVDWSDIMERERFMVLRAALALDGRAIPLYEAVYPLRDYNSQRTHKTFLATLKTLLPEHCVPIIVTDAGFRGPWFKSVQALGWHWIGRIRNGIKYRLHSRLKWRQTQALYYRAKTTPTYLGSAELSYQRPYDCHLYLYRKPPQGRKEHRTIIHTIRHGHSREWRKQQRDPWLLATNLSPEEFSPKKMVALYGKRMQIEECFRDLKSDRFGFGITCSRSKNINRLNTLLLIAALATLCLWWVGLYAKSKGWHRHFQANTVRDRNVLSVPFLALAVIRRKDYPIRVTELLCACIEFQEFISLKNAP
jgi:hypothetical protein